MKSAIFCLCLGAALAASAEVRVGIIGCDTSHTTAFAKMLNVTKPAFSSGYRVTVAHKWGSRDIYDSTNRIPKYVAQLKEWGVKMCDSVDDLLKEVDVVLLETNDGREHLWQAEKCFKAGKPVFIDKPLAHNLRDALKICELAKKYNAKFFTSSGLRYSSVIAEVAAGKYGKVRGVFYATPAPVEEQGTHARYTWYGIHGFEPIVTMMGTGAESVRTVFADKTDVVTMTWKDGRVATFRASRDDWNYSGFAYPEGGKPVALSGSEGYLKLLEKVIAFFKTGVSPVPPEETLEIFALMEAAEMSGKNGGRAVTLAEALKAAKD